MSGLLREGGRKRRLRDPAQDMVGPAKQKPETGGVEDARAEAAAGFGPMEVADEPDDSVLQSAQWARDKLSGRLHTYHVQSPGFSPRERVGADG